MTKFYENLLKACSLRGKSPSAVAKEIGISKSTVTIWKNGSSPSDISVQKLADYFGVTKEVLLGEPAPKAAEAAPEPSGDLERLAAALAQLNEEGREKLLDYAADLVASGRYGKKDGAAGLGQNA